jgi:site-specific recombinase XerD
VLEVLKEYYLSIGIVDDPLNKDFPLFPNQHGLHYNSNYISRRATEGLRNVLKNESMDDRRHITTHSTRHGSASLHSYFGADVREIQELFSNSKISTTEIYLETPDKIEKHASRRLDINRLNKRGTVQKE